MFDKIKAILNNNATLPLSSYMNDWYIDYNIINDTVHLRVYRWEHNAGWHVTHDEAYQATSNEEASSIGQAIGAVCDIFANAHK